MVVPPAKGTERGSPTPWVASSSGVALSDHGREPQAEDGTQGHFKCRDAQAQMSSAPRRLGCTNLCVTGNARQWLPCPRNPRARGSAVRWSQPFPSTGPGPGPGVPRPPSEAPGAGRAHTSYTCPTPHLLALVSSSGLNRTLETEVPPRGRSKPVAIRPINGVLRFFSLEQSLFLSLHTLIFLFNRTI